MADKICFDTVILVMLYKQFNLVCRFKPFKILKAGTLHIFLATQCSFESVDCCFRFVIVKILAIQGTVLSNSFE